MFNLVMFDLDGTLVDTAPEVAAAVNAVLAERGLLRAFEWHYAAHSGRRSRLCPQALDGLRALRKQGVATALVTNKETRFAAAVLHAHDLWEFLDAVVCGDMLQYPKPDPLAVEHCLARFRTPPQRALFAGGSDIDVATARNAGVALCPSILAAAQRLSK